jgi:hypothetical protein
MVSSWWVGAMRGRGVGTWTKNHISDNTTKIREIRENQWDKWEIKVSGRVWVHEVKLKGLKMIGIT